MFLAGDIGGTNFGWRCLIRNFNRDSTNPSPRTPAGRVLPRSVPRVSQERAARCGEADPQRVLWCGRAGRHGKVTLTNLSWQLTRSTLAKDLGLEKISLINDLVAHAEGLSCSSPSRS